MKLAYRRNTLLETTGGSFSGLQVVPYFYIYFIFNNSSFLFGQRCNRIGSYYLSFLMNFDSILVPIVLSSVDEKYKESLATIEFPY